MLPSPPPNFYRPPSVFLLHTSACSIPLRAVIYNRSPTLCSSRRLHLTPPSPSLYPASRVIPSLLPAPYPSGSGSGSHTLSPLNARLYSCTLRRPRQRSSPLPHLLPSSRVLANAPRPLLHPPSSSRTLLATPAPSIVLANAPRHTCTLRHSRERSSPLPHPLPSSRVLAMPSSPLLPSYTPPFSFTFTHASPRSPSGSGPRPAAHRCARSKNTES